MLDVRVLGGLSAAVDRRPVDLPADARARELLARLALTPGPHARSALAGRLRPDVAEESARKTLRNALYELRRALGPQGADAIVVSGDRIELSPACAVDLWEYRRLLAGGELAAAADAAKGDLLDGFDDEWAQRARNEHGAELAGLLGTLAAQAEKAGDLPAAVGWSRRRVELEPLSEAAQRELIRLLALGGDRPAALTAARTMSERLQSELGIPASAATRALVEDVRRGRVALAAASPGAAATPGAVTPAQPALPAVLATTEPCEGREPALTRIEQAWADAVSGELRFALVSGEPGIGKTTLAGELARRVHAQGGAVLLGRSDEHALLPFQPWIELLERVLHALPGDEAEHWLTAHDGALARLLPARSPAPADAAGPRERYLAFELVNALLDDVAQREPVLLVLDDVHWADADSLSLLRHLMRSRPRRRMLVLLCARPTELEPVVAQTLAELRRVAPLVQIDLRGLDDDAVAAVLARRTGAGDREAARRFRTRCGGNPFFLDELLREAQEGGADTASPPAGVREVIARRLSRFDEATLRVLDAAAICGTDFDLATVASVDGRPITEVLASLDGAIEAALVAATDQRERYAFAHALVGDSIVHALSASARAQLHLRVAEVLLERHDSGGVGAGEIVWHLRGAGALADGGLLATWEIAAAREASAGLAHAEAAAHYEAALAVAAGVPEAERGRLLLALGHAHDRAGRREPAREAFAAAAELARGADDADLLARAALGHGGVAIVIAAPDPTNVRLLDEALAATPEYDFAGSARLLARKAVELYYADNAGAVELSALAVKRARHVGNAAALAAALNAHRVALWSPDHADERLTVSGEMIDAARSAGDRETELQGRNWRVVDLIELGRIEQAVAEIDAYEALADAVALPHFRWYVPLWRATLALLAGRWQDADDLAEQALVLGGRADDPNAPLFVGIQRAHSLYTQRRIGELDRERLVTGGAASPAPADWLVHLAMVDAETGATEDARRLVRELSSDGCGALTMGVNWHGACILADAAVLVGDREAGAALHALLEPHARLFPVIARAIGCLGSAEYYVGRLAGLLGRRDEAVTRLRRAVAENERAGAGPQAALSLLRLGETLADGGDHGPAREALQQVAQRAAALEMPNLAADAERRLAATSV